MTKLEAGLTRDQAFALLQEHNKDPFHIQHGQTVEGVMRYFARDYDPENEDFWGIVGLLHDLDWEEHSDEPAMHTIYAAEILEAAGGSPELIHAIQSHSSIFNDELPKPELYMEKVLYTVDELTGLIGATVLMRPSKSVMDLEVKSLKKKFKDKRFAAGVDRQVIIDGAQMLGWTLDETFARTIDAMRSFAPDRDTFGQEQEAAASESGADGAVETAGEAGAAGAAAGETSATVATAGEAAASGEAAQA